MHILINALTWACEKYYSMCNETDLKNLKVLDSPQILSSGTGNPVNYASCVSVCAACACVGACLEQNKDFTAGFLHTSGDMADQLSLS